MTNKNPPFCGSSETTRKEPSFSADDFYTYGHAPHVPRISEAFLQWFVGFFEGNGTIDTNFPATATTETRLKLCITQTEKKIILLLAKTFGFGNVSSFHKNNQTYWQWTLESKSSLLRIAFLLSGNLILPKMQKQFDNWISMGMEKQMFQQPFKSNKPWTASVSLENGWLSGFIDAKGCFSVGCSENSPSLKLSQKMTLTQQKITTGDEDVFKQILCLFDSKGEVYHYQKLLSSSNASIYMRISFGSLKCHKLIVHYCFAYKLRTIKYVAFYRWWRIYLYRLNGIPQSEKSFRKIRRLAKAINVYNKSDYLQRSKI